VKLYYALTPNPRKACAVAKYLDLPVEYVFVDLKKQEHRKPDFLALNPNSKVPVLVDGDLKLWEAMAIMCHFAEKAGSDLWPDDARRIEIIRWISWDAHHFSRHAGSLFFEHVIKPFLGSTPDPVTIEESMGFFRRFAAILDDHLNGRKYIVGDRPTLADFSVASMLPYAKPSKMPIEEFPQISRWYDRINQIEAWREPFPAAEKVDA
jgi:glutathione S-transferase